MKTGVLLSGCGVYDGTEIHESVLALLALSQNNIDYICTAPNINQHHVINHINGEEMNEERSVLIESARIARGDIISLSELNKNTISSIVIAGGLTDYSDLINLKKLNTKNIEGIISGKSFYEGNIDLAEAQKILN